MGKAKAVLMAVFFVGGFQAVSFAESEITGNMNLLLGAKTLEAGDWEPVDSQSAIGLQFDLKKKDWPVSLAFGYTQTSGEESDSSVNYDGKTKEIDFGIKWISESDSKIRPFIGGGITNIKAEAGIDIPSIPFDDSVSGSGTGFWIAGGIYWTLKERINLGFQYKISRASVDLDGVDVEAGGNTLGLLLGYHF